MGALIEPVIRRVATALMRRCTPEEKEAAAAKVVPAWCTEAEVRACLGGLFEAVPQDETAGQPWLAARTPGEVRLAVKSRWLAMNRARLQAATLAVRRGDRNGLERLWRARGCKEFKDIVVHSDQYKAIKQAVLRPPPRAEIRTIF